MTGSQNMKVNGVAIDDTFAEAFGMSGTALIITADTLKWAMIAATTMTGFGTSVIGCGAECGIDYEVPADQTPDGRPGVRVLVFGFSPDAILPQLKNRVGQCVLTSPGSACYNGLDSPQKLALSAGPRFFGDGWQIAKRFGVFGATLITFFLAEMGDKTQVATVAMAAHYAAPLLVVIGTTLGMLIADVPAVFVGDKLAAKIPMKLVHSIAAAVFAVLGIATLLGAGAKLGF